MDFQLFRVGNPFFLSELIYKYFLTHKVKNISLCLNICLLVSSLFNLACFLADSFFLCKYFSVIFIENVEIRIYSADSHISSFIVFQQGPEFLTQDKQT